MNLASGGFVYIYDSITGYARRPFVFIVSRDKSERGNRKCGPPNRDMAGPDIILLSGTGFWS